MYSINKPCPERMRSVGSCLSHKDDNKYEEVEDDLQMKTDNMKANSV